jgi:hypothetical protein
MATSIPVQTVVFDNPTNDKFHWARTHDRSSTSGPGVVHDGPGLVHDG